MSYLKDKIELSLAETKFNIEEKLAQYPPFYKWLLIFGIVATIPAYFVTKKISYGVWSGKYQASLVAAKPSFENPLPIKVGKTYFSSYGEGLFSAATEVTNENLELSLKEAPYQLELTNDEGEIIYTENKKTFFLPNEKKFLIIPKIETTEKIANAIISFPNELNWQKRLQIPKVEIITSKPQIENKYDPIRFEVVGNFTNKSAYRLGNVRINIAIFNTRNEMIAASYHEAQSIKPFETREYRLIWPGVHSNETDFISVYPETNPLQPENLQIPENFSNPANDLGRN